MKISVFKGTEKETDLPIIVEGTVKLGKAFEIYEENGKMKNQFSFLK